MLPTNNALLATGRVLLYASGAHSKFDTGENLRKVKIFGIIYIESEVKLTKYYYRRNENNERI